MNIIQKKEPKTQAVSTKLTDSQNEKIVKLAQKHGITKSNLISQLLEIGFKEVSKNKTF